MTNGMLRIHPNTHTHAHTRQNKVVGVNPNPILVPFQFPYLGDTRLQQHQRSTLLVAMLKGQEKGSLATSSQLEPTDNKISVKVIR